MTTTRPIHVIGGGLAGSEAAWQIARPACPSCCTRCAPLRMTEAHKTGGLAELVCSNSFRSDDWQNNAVGLLHEEMRRAGSLIMAAGDRHKLPAGGALAVDRDRFSGHVTHAHSRRIPLSPSSAARSPACRRTMGQRHHRHRARSPRRALSRAIQAADRRSRARLLRCHRPDRASGQHRSSASPGGSRATTRPAPAAPAPTTSTAR